MALLKKLLFMWGGGDDEEGPPVIPPTESISLREDGGDCLREDGELELEE